MFVFLFSFTISCNSKKIIILLYVTIWNRSCCWVNSTFSSWKKKKNTARRKFSFLFVMWARKSFPCTNHPSNQQTTVNKRIRTQRSQSQNQHTTTTHETTDKRKKEQVSSKVYYINKNRFFSSFILQPSLNVNIYIFWLPITFTWIKKKRTKQEAEKLCWKKAHVSSIESWEYVICG